VSAIFGVLQTSSNGLHVYRTWLDAVGDNIANLNTVKPTSEDAFQARYVVAQELTSTGATSPTAAGIGKGSQVAGVLFGDAEGRMVYDPTHPYADEDGLVRYPDIDLGDQMTQLLMAQRGYQANLAVVTRAQEAYQSALQIGK
jgi:flagellar basal-body rod protein FlgC